MTQSLSQIERQWYVEQIGGASPQRPFNDIKRQYFTSQIGGSAQTPLQQLEKAWMIDYITTNGGTPYSEESDLWKQMVIAAGGTPTDERSENMRRFFQLA